MHRGVFAGVLLVAAALPGVAAACSCARLTRHQVIAQADAAFTGRVAAVRTSPDGRSLHATIDVAIRIKGDLPGRVEVVTSAHPTMCGVALAPGERHTFAGRRGPGGAIQINSCAMIPLQRAD